MGRRVSRNTARSVRFQRDYCLLAFGDHGCGFRHPHKHTVVGYSFELPEYEAFKFYATKYKDGSWGVSEASTGYKVPGSSAKTRAVAIQGARATIKEHGIKKLRQLMDRVLRPSERA